MAELSTIARPYAEALFSVAQGSGESLDGWLAADRGTRQRLMTHPQVAEVVADPNLDHEQVFGLLTGMMKAPLPADGGQLPQAADREPAPGGAAGGCGAVPPAEELAPKVWPTA